MSTTETAIRLRRIISDYHHAAPDYGPHFETAAEILAGILHSERTATAQTHAVDAAADEHPEPVAWLLRSAHVRLTHDIVSVGRAANDEINARTTTPSTKGATRDSLCG